MAPGRRGCALAAALVLALPACTTTGGDGASTPTSPPTSSEPLPTLAPTEMTGGTLRFALGSDPAAIDPRFLRDEEGSYVADAVFDSLVRTGRDLTRVMPAAAEAWEVSDDGLVYTFTLREGAKFHDGTRVSADAFVRAFQRIADGTAEPPSFLYYQLAPIEGFEDARGLGEPLRGVQAVDERTLRITLKERFDDLLYVLADPSLAPVPAIADEDPDAFAERPVGNGPFEMAAEWQHNQFIRVVRNDDHPDPPVLDEIVFQIYADDASREQQYEDFQNGQLDVAEVPAASVSQAASQYGRSRDGYEAPGVIDGVTGTVYAYGFNTALPPFDDPAVRRAMSMLIDRDRIVDEITRGTRIAADAIVPSVIPGAATGACEHCVYDPDAARALLTDDEGELIVGGDEPIRVMHNRGATNERVARRIAADIEDALGITVDVVSAELEPFVQRLQEGDVQVFRTGWQAGYASPGSILQPLFHGRNIGQDNWFQYANPDVDALLDEARQEPNATRRRNLYRQAEAMILADAPAAPIFFYRHARVVSSEVVAFRIGPLGDIEWADVELERDA